MQVGSGSRLFSRPLGRAAAYLFVAALLLAPGSAQAVDFSLNVEFDDGVSGSFADVSVVEEDMGLRFEIALQDALGPDADLHVFYFNLEGGVPELQIESDDPVTTAYVLEQAPSVAGGAGSDFDYGVHFGNGAGGRGNGVLQFASFLVSPVDTSLSLGLDAFLNAATSAAQGGSILANAAAHVQGTSLVRGANSETVGGVVPEPSTGLLLACGLLLAAGRRTRREPETA